MRACNSKAYAFACWSAPPGGSFIANNCRSLCRIARTYHVIGGSEGSSCQLAYGDTRHATEYDVEISAAASRYLFSSNYDILAWGSVHRNIRDKFCRKSSTCKFRTKYTASRRHLYTTLNGLTVPDAQRSYCQKIQAIDPPSVTLSTPGEKGWGRKVVASLEGGNTSPVGLYGYTQLTSSAGFHQMGEDAVQR